MTEVYERPARLVIAGGGHVGKALSTIAAMCGFRVTIVDDRPEYADPERFPEADDVIRGRFDEVLPRYPIDALDVRGRCHPRPPARRNQPARRRRARGGVRWHDRLTAACKGGPSAPVDDGADPEAVAAIHTPIGLDIGAETPEEIAVAIMGEIIQVRRQHFKR